MVGVFEFSQWCVLEWMQFKIQTNWRKLEKELGLCVVLVNKW